MNNKKIVILTLFFLFTIPFISHSLENPSAAYCNEMGYRYVIENTKEGEIGYCILPNGTKIDAWDFFRCLSGKEFSYCAIHGFESESINGTCYCILPNGTKIDMVTLMNLSFKETFCGDGICGIPETYLTCPQDCLSGSYDGFCDGVEDGICDPDCVDSQVPEKDPDCNYTCGDGICEKSKGETYQNCCVDCDCPKRKICVNNTCVYRSIFCGNGKCEKFENYALCSKDCPSGGRDGFCDGVEDGMCDPDCERDKDPDCYCNNNGICEKEFENYSNCPTDCKKPRDYNIFIYAIIGLIILAILISMIISAKRENNPQL